MLECKQKKWLAYQNILLVCEKKNISMKVFSYRNRLSIMFLVRKFFVIKIKHCRICIYIYTLKFPCDTMYYIIKFATKMEIIIL